ncbi:MAG TPA: M28 family peptidase [Humisphaera sp.]
MRNTPTSRWCAWAGRSLLVALVGCTAAAFADAPTSRLAVGPSVAKPQTGEIVDIRKSVAFLASEALEGRGSGSPGIDMAAGYIAGKFEQIGLRTAPGLESYYQPFKLTTSVTVDPTTALSPGGGADWAAKLGRAPKLDDDFQPLTFSAEGKLDAPVVFVGYGVADKDRNYDDYANVDVKGKVVLAFRFEPHTKDGASAFTKKKDDYSPNAAIPEKARLAASKGAAALVLVNPPNFMPDDKVTSFARAGQTDRAGLPVIQVKRPVAEAMLAAAGLGKLSDLQRKIDEGGAPASQPLAGVSAAGKVVLKKTEKDVRNVVGVLPGKGPRANEYVVVGAHYDHLGRGGIGSLAPFSRAVHHGADDNASGTTAMMKLAERLAAGEPPARSIVFVAFTGEELGLIGSAHFLKEPPVPVPSIAAMVNFDMVGRVKDNRLQIGGIGTAPAFEKIVADAASGSPFKLNLKDKGGFGPSDHASFAAKKVPVLFFFSGIHADYHRPSDTADKINYEGMEQVIDLGHKVVAAVAAAPREQYVGTFDSMGMTPMGSGPASGSGGTRGVSLGVLPSYAGEDVKGVLIDGTGAGSAAAKAGLQGGDVLTRFDDMALNNLQDLTAALGKSKPGQKVKIKLLRGGKEMEVEATLTERKAPPPEAEMGQELPPGHGPVDPHGGPVTTKPATRPG